MTTPTLAQFSKALDAVRAKYPDAPGLPEGYYFEQCHGQLALYSKFDAPLPDAAALALCVTVALEIGAWYTTRPGCTLWPFSIGLVVQETAIRVDEPTRRHCTWASSLDGNSDHDSLPSAALAMLEVIGGR